MGNNNPADVRICLVFAKCKMLFWSLAFGATVGSNAMKILKLKKWFERNKCAEQLSLTLSLLCPVILFIHLCSVIGRFPSQRHRERQTHTVELVNNSYLVCFGVNWIIHFLRVEPDIHRGDVVEEQTQLFERVSPQPQLVTNSSVCEHFSSSFFPPLRLMNSEPWWSDGDVEGGYLTWPLVWNIPRLLRPDEQL